jgi:cytochrome P450
MAAGPISMDPSVVKDPDIFDGFRYYGGGDKLNSSFVSTGPTGMHFGLGRYACPGRFFATFVMKAILSRFLVEYEFKFGPGQAKRPKNTLIGDKVIPNVSTDVYLQKRLKP